MKKAHFEPRDLLCSLGVKEGDFGTTALVCGQKHRAKQCLEKLKEPVKNFTFLGYSFWTGEYKGKKITVGNGGFYSPDTAFITEMLCVGGVDNLIRLGSCGALKRDVNIGDYILVQQTLRGDGATKYYVGDDFIPQTTEALNKSLYEVFSSQGKVHKGKVWTTDALFKETEQVVNSYVKKGAIGVDMVTSPFVTIPILYKKRCSAVLTVSDNLITGEKKFQDKVFFNAEIKMTDKIFEVLDEI